MKKITLLTVLLLCLTVGKSVAQETFEDKAKMIAAKIDAITKEEKAALKEEVEAVNVKLENKSITAAEADAQKMALAEKRANNIDTRVADAQAELNQLVKDRVDGKIKEKDSSRTFMFKFDSKRKAKELNGETRTTSQFVLAAGFNNLVTDGAVAHSDFGYLRSVFYEWGITHNTRILKESNLLHFKYGFSFVYNHLAATDNRYFVDNGEQTNLEVFPEYLRKKDSYFKNVFVTIPLHLEFDFSKTEMKDDKKLFKSHQGFRVGIGGFVGYNTNSKQFLSYKIDNYRISEKQKGNWNIEDWNYGLSAYVGWQETSLYVKYDLNPMFKNNSVDQNNISMGIRFDLN